MLLASIPYTSIFTLASLLVLLPGWGNAQWLVASLWVMIGFSRPVWWLAEVPKFCTFTAKPIAIFGGLSFFLSAADDDSAEELKC